MVQINKLILLSMIFILVLGTAVMADELKIDDIKIYVNDNLKSGPDEDGGDIKGVRSGDTVEFKVRSENTFTDSTTIEDIRVRVTIRDIDNGDDLVESSSRFDLDADDTKTKTLEFIIPSGVKSGEYDILVEIYGEDEDNHDQEDDVGNLDLFITGPNHELEFTQLTVSPSVLACGGSGTVIAKIRNNGKYSETVGLSIKNTALGVSYAGNFIIQPDNEVIRSIPITLNNAPAGNYDLAAMASYTGAIETGTLTVAVSGTCSGGSTSSGSTSTGVTATAAGVASVPVSRIKKGMSTTDVVAIVVGVVVALIIFSLVMALVLTNSRRR